MNEDATADHDAAVDDLEAVLAGTEKLLGGVAPDQAHQPTPCPGFDVSQLIDHMLGWSASYAVRAWGEDFDGDANAHRAGPDPADEFRSYADRILAGYRRGDGPDKTLPVGVLLMDYQVHGWDLARATGQAVPFNDREAQRALETGRQMLKPEYRGPDKEFGVEVPAPDDASAMDQLVAFLGRDPEWAPQSV